MVVTRTAHVRSGTGKRCPIEKDCQHDYLRCTKGGICRSITTVGLTNAQTAFASKRSPAPHDMGVPLAGLHRNSLVFLTILSRATTKGFCSALGNRPLGASSRWQYSGGRFPNAEQNPLVVARESIVRK